MFYVLYTYEYIYYRFYENVLSDKVVREKKLIRIDIMFVIYFEINQEQKKLFPNKYMKYFKKNKCYKK